MTCQDRKHGLEYSMKDMLTPMQPVWKKILDDDPDLRIVIYSGDDDAVCATLGTQYWMYDDKWGLEVTNQWRAWDVDGQVAGFRVDFGLMSLITVHGAGHMVPVTQPDRGLELFRRFVMDE